MRNDLLDFVENLIPAQEKNATSSELEEFEYLLAQADEEEKVAYGMMGGMSDDWLSKFQYTPLYEKAIALKEKDLALEKRRMEERQRREKAYRHDDSTWNEQDKLCLEKDKLTLELHKWRASQEAKTKLKMQVMKIAGNGDPLREHDKRLGKLKKSGKDDKGMFGVKHPVTYGITHLIHQGNAQEAKKSLRALKAQGASSTDIETLKEYIANHSKKAELVEYTGHVNNGEPQAPEWPRAALGVDSAGRRATPEELRPQTIARNPDVQHVDPQAGGDEFERKVSSMIVSAVGGARGVSFLGETKQAAQKQAFIRLPNIGLGGRFVRYFGGGGSAAARAATPAAREAAAVVRKATPVQQIDPQALKSQLQQHAQSALEQQTKGTLLEGLSAAKRSPFAHNVAAPSLSVYAQALKDPTASSRAAFAGKLFDEAPSAVGRSIRERLGRGRAAIVPPAPSAASQLAASPVARRAPPPPSPAAQRLLSRSAPPAAARKPVPVPSRTPTLISTPMPRTQPAPVIPLRRGPASNNPTLMGVGPEPLRKAASYKKAGMNPGMRLTDLLGHAAVTWRAT